MIKLPLKRRDGVRRLDNHSQLQFLYQPVILNTLVIYGPNTAYLITRSEGGGF